MNKIDLDYQRLLRDILKNGVKKSDRTGTGTLSVFGRQIRHSMADGFPLLTTKKMYFKGIVTELLWFLRGDTNIKYLVDNDCHIWDGDAYKNYCNYDYYEAGKVIISNDKKFEREVIKINISQEGFINKIKTDDEFAKKWGDLGRVYGAQWRRWKTVKYKGQYGAYGASERWDEEYIDQIANLINDLKNDPDSRRLLVTAWNPADVPNSVLPPCHIGFQVYTRELSLDERMHYWFHKNKPNRDVCDYVDELENNLKQKELDNHNTPKRAISLKWEQRSVDTFLGLPFNIASYGLLLEIIANEVNMVPEELIGDLGDTHLYLNHIEQVEEQLSRTPFNLPTLRINEYRSDTYTILFDTDKWSHKDFAIENYESHPAIKAPLSN